MKRRYDTEDERLRDEMAQARDEARRERDEAWAHLNALREHAARAMCIRCDLLLTERDEARADFASACGVVRRQEARAEKAERERDEALSRVAAEAGKDLAAWAVDLDAAEAAHARVVAERDEARRERDEARAQVKAWQSEELSRRAERDEARAEVSRREREHGALVETAQKALAYVTAERDEARAEVDRARADVERFQRDGHPSDSTR